MYTVCRCALRQIFRDEIDLYTVGMSDQTRPSTHPVNGGVYLTSCPLGLSEIEEVGPSLS